MERCSNDIGNETRVFPFLHFAQGQASRFLVLLLLLIGCAGKNDEPGLLTEKVTEGTLTVKVATRGEVKAEKSRKVIVPRFTREWMQLKIVKLVPEGADVKKGDFLATLDKTELDKHKRDAESDVKRAEAELGKAKKILTTEKNKLDWAVARLEAELQVKELDRAYRADMPGAISTVEAETDLEKSEKIEEYAEAEYEQVRLLAETGDESETELTTKKLEHDIAEADKKIKQVQYEFVMSGALPKEIDEAKLAVEEARITLAKAKTELEYKTKQYELDVEQAKWQLEREKLELQRINEAIDESDFHSPADGVVAYARVWQGQALEKIKEGMTVHPYSTMMTIEDTSSMIAEVEVEEAQIAQVKVGLKAEIVMDAIAADIYSGVVDEVGTIARGKGAKGRYSWWKGKKETSGVRVFDVKVRLDNCDSKVRPGLNGQVDIIVEKLANVLSVPLDAIFKKGGLSAGGHAQAGRSIVYVWKDGKPEERTVVTGETAEGRVVIEQGLEEGEEVCLTAPTQE